MLLVVTVAAVVAATAAVPASFACLSAPPSGYKTMEEVVRAAGGDWHESANPMADYTQTSDRIVTGMNPASAKSVAHEMM